MYLRCRFPHPLPPPTRHQQCRCTCRNLSLLLSTSASWRPTPSERTVTMLAMARWSGVIVTEMCRSHSVISRNRWLYGRRNQTRSDPAFNFMVTILTISTWGRVDDS
ncbi:hypothetical protein BaRGS_00007691 [Batillaria attramentaria]|uniref:Uncharacterized protein n=1 Tax=Batillaria attramentaria TaxID=370345 RepID=A0ABD0LP18_9CAEN